MAKMWAGRTAGEVNKLADSFNSSISFDSRMYKQDMYEPARTAEQAVGVFTVTEEGLRFEAAGTTAWTLDGLEDGTLFIKNR